MDVTALSRHRSAIAAGLFLVLSVFAAWGAMQAAQVKPLPVRLAAPHVAKKPANSGKSIKPKPPEPSTYETEAAMTPRELMARWEPAIGDAAKRFRVPAAWIRAVMRMESGGRTMMAESQPITSTAGAMGIMQVMPDTYETMRALYRLGPDPYDPGDNLTAGAAYLGILYKAYGYPDMFAAYNDGPKMLEAHNAGHHPWPAETVNYVAGITAILSGGSPGRVGGAQVRLTRPDGTPIMVDAAAVLSVRAALPGEYAPSVQTVIMIRRMRQGVRESLGQTRAILRAHGGRV